MIKRFLTDQLRPGMYVIDTGLALSDDSSIYSVEGEIEDEHQVQGILDRGFTEAFVDTSQGRYFFEKPEEKNKVNVLYEVLYEGSPDASEDPFPLQSHIHKKMPQQNKAGKVDAAAAVPLYEEVPRMLTVYESSFDMIRELHENLKQNDRIDLKRNMNFVETVLDSLGRNPHAFSTLIKLRSYADYEFAHSLNVSVLSVSFGRFLNLPDDALRCLGLGGLFHDVGKLRVPLSVLNKPGKLTAKEFSHVKRHCEYGHEMLAGEDGLDGQVLRIIMEHHERYSGSGYPQGLEFSQTSRLAVIVGMADMYDALTSERPYNAPLSQHKALSVMYGLRNTDFHPVLMDKFVRFLGVYPIGTMVKLRNGVLGVVNRFSDANPMRPVIKTLLQGRGMWLPAHQLDLSSPKCVADDQYQIVNSYPPTSFKVDTETLL